MKSTKELARQLGLLRRRSTTEQQSRDAKKAKKTNQIFAYLIVIDFESTCWKDKRNISQEIIEFPAVLLNTSTGAIESEFHTYILPEEHPQLSAFCTELTGITQDQVEGGIPLRLCLTKFSRWLKKQEDQRNITYNSVCDGKELCTFVTWSDWDLSVCLHYECRRKQLLKPPALNSWIDLRATYKNFYQRKPNGLHGALQDVGIEFRGRQHSGLDDARNTASLAWRMMCDGCIMNTTRTLPGTKPLKRKQDMPARERPAKCQANPVTAPQMRQLQDPQFALNGSAVSEDRLVSRTQALTDGTAARGGMIADRQFKIWEDASQETASVLNVMNLETFGKTPNGHANNQTRIKTGEGCKTGRFVSGQGSCKAEPRTKDIAVRSSMLVERGWQSLDRTTKRIPFVKDAVSTNAEMACAVPQHGKHSISKPASSTIVSPSGLLCSRQRPTDPEIPSARLCKEGPGNHTVETGQASTSLMPSAPVSHCTSVTPKAPAVFKMPLTTPVRDNESDRQSPASGFKMPFTPGCHYRTPCSSTIRTPLQSNRTPTASLCLLGGKITPPMCRCGRRAKRRTVQSPGPNMDRPFFSCTLGRRRSSEAGLRDATNTKEGCSYFKWESAVLSEKHLSLSASPANHQNVLAQKQRHTPNLSNKTQPGLKLRTQTESATPVGFTGKRLGIAMRAALRQQSQTKS